MVDRSFSKMSISIHTIIIYLKDEYAKCTTKLRKINEEEMNIPVFTMDQLLGFLALGAIVFSVYRYFRDPQVNSSQIEALIKQRAQLKDEDYERRFASLQKNLEDALKLALNHSHTVEIEVRTLNTQFGHLSRELVMLKTIIDERIPKKGV